MLYQFIVHSTTKISSTLYDVARESRENRPRRHGAPKEQIGERVADKVDQLGRNLEYKLALKEQQLQAKVARHVEQLDRLQERLGALEVWLRSEPGERRPRFSRDEIAEAALQIADVEGFPALSMRRIAAELGAGTMTLYHYVHTKDELLALVTDAVMGEVVVPHGDELPAGWREAVTLVARRTRDALRRHPWMFDIMDEPALGPNAVRHFDQSMQAVASFPGGLATRLDIVFTVDEFVFGYCQQERNQLGNDGANVLTAEMIAYVNELLGTGDYPQLAELAQDYGMQGAWDMLDRHLRNPDRFDRNLARILDGFEDAPAQGTTA